MPAKKPAAAAEAAPPRNVVHLAGHPRARRHIALAKSWAGLLGFGVTLMLSMQAGVGGFESGVRAIVAGSAFYLLGWAGAVAVWGQLAVGEVHARRAAARAEAERLRAEAEILSAASDDRMRQRAASQAGLT